VCGSDEAFIDAAGSLAGGDAWPLILLVDQRGSGSLPGYLSYFATSSADGSFEIRGRVP